MMNFGHYKNFDGSCPLGPCIVVDELNDPQDIPFTTHVSGDLRQNGNTSGMIFGFAEILAYVSTDQTVQPGDMISAGTCRGTAMDSSDYGADGKPLPDLFLKVGDVVEVASPAIGTLRTEIVAKS
jgi:acylpyruvate hydrolase